MRLPGVDGAAVDGAARGEGQARQRAFDGDGLALVDVGVGACAVEGVDVEAVGLLDVERERGEVVAEVGVQAAGGRA